VAQTIKIKRGTRAQLEAAKTAGTLAAGEPYLITDQNRPAIGTATDAYAAGLIESDIGTTVQAYDADIPTVAASQAEMEAGTETALRSMSPLRVAQAVAALGGSSGGSLTAVSYDNRGNLRTDETSGWAVVDGLGLFQYVAGSDEPDDDESCFATTNGRWLLQAVHWDVVDAWQLPDDEVRDEADEDAETRLTDTETRLTDTETRWPGRVRFASAAFTLTSLAAVTQTSFTVTVTGATTADHVVVTPPNALGGRISVFGRVTADNAVTVYVNNPSAAAQSLTSGTWRVAVISEF
jgi:hypothetical protein